tara:strand:- start:84176 stop:84616 length:441 start_codon:yes stop_codon:yes gene_type:complete
MKELIQIMKTIDASRCYEIRKNVFIIEQGVPKDLELDEYDKSAMHVLALYDSKAVGCARVREFSDYYKVERVAVLREFRGKGIAREIMLFIENDIVCKKKDIVLNAQASVIDFYTKLGYVGEGKRFMEAGIEHLKMKKTSNFGGLS